MIKESNLEGFHKQLTPGAINLDFYIQTVDLESSVPENVSDNGATHPYVFFET